MSTGVYVELAVPDFSKHLRFESWKGRVRAARRAVVLMGSFVGLRLSARGTIKPLIAIPSVLATVAGLVLFSLTFSASVIPLILELVVLIMFLLMLIVPARVTQVQGLPGIGLAEIPNAIGAILLICGVAAAIVPIAIGWALDQGWVIFKEVLYLFAIDLGHWWAEQPLDTARRLVVD